MHAAALFLSLSLVGQADDLRVFDDVRAKSADRLLYDHLKRQAIAASERRREQYEAIETEEDCRNWQAARREFFVEAIGGFPDKTPLNAEVVGTLKGDGYRVEKVIYESRPNHHVTAALYLPEDVPPPYPAVLIACGHSQNGKAAGYNQRLGIIHAKHGMAALCYDPIGQGERSQFLKPDGSRVHRGTTTEHFLVGVGAVLGGTSTAQYRIWDGLRGLDYLAGRPDVDPERLGVTGCSGGGTLSSYIMALDDRVACAAPACYITTFRRLIETIGPQDAEQNVFGQVAFGMDHPDYLLMRAPKPTLIAATTNDFFDITGTWDAFRQAKRFYTRLGHPERVNLVEVDSKHGVTPESREAITAWMQRWLRDIDESVTEPNVPLWTDEQLQCTPRGQVLLLDGEKSVIDLNTDRAAELAEQRPERSPDELRKAVRERAAIPQVDEQPMVKTVGKSEADGVEIRKLLITAHDGFPLPALAFVPAEPKGEAYLYLHGRGKDAAAGPDGEIRKLAGEGHVVLAVDLRGLGETQAADPESLLGDWKNFFMLYLLGRSYVGDRAADALTAARVLATLETENPRPVRVIATHDAAVPALHAAAVAPQPFESVKLRNTIRSWNDVVPSTEPRNGYANAIHGALEDYDLPQLVENVENVTIE